MSIFFDRYRGDHELSEEMKMKITMNHKDYKDRYKSCDGICTLCSEWTSEKAEPDAEYYFCSHCENRTLIGVRKALELGLINIKN